MIRDRFLSQIRKMETKDDPSRKAIGMIAEMRPPLLHSRHRFKKIDSEGSSFVTGLEGFKE